MASESELTNQFSFAGQIGIGKHSLLLYENPESTEIIQFRIINQGLQKGISQILLTNENIRKVEDKMADEGIDVEDWKRKNLLHILNSMHGDSENLLKSFLSMWEKIRKESSGQPFMIIGKVVSDVGTEKAMLAELNLERYVHRNLNNTFGALCCYDINNIEQNERERWISDLSQNHSETFLIR